MLSESPAVGSVHGHRVGRTSVAPPGTDCERRWTLRRASWTPPPPPLRRRQSLNWNWKARTRLLPAVLRPIPTGPGRSSSGSRATPGSRGGRMSRLACACAGAGQSVDAVDAAAQGGDLLLVPLRAPRTSEGRKPRRCRRRRLFHAGSEPHSGALPPHSASAVVAL